MRAIPQPQQEQLLAIARSTSQAALAKLPQPNVSQPTITGEYGGAFVTLYVAGELRGCVGSFATTNDLASTIRDITLCSLEDKRFADHRVSFDDLPNLTIEISVLSPLSPATDSSSIIIGEHGIVVRKGKRQGCFLPKVAVERGWDPEMFLTQVCAMKADLPPKAWLEPDVEIFTFTSQVFSSPKTSDSGNARS